MTDVVVDRLHIRGAGARRLATVAARTLPAALEAALGDLADGALGRLEVTLDVDPADYDDATLALLWADRIRAAALAAGAPRRSAPPATPDAAPPGRAPGGREGAGGPGGVDRPDVAGSVEDTVATLLAWLDAAAPGAAVPLAVARLVDRHHAADVAARLGAAGTSRLVAALTGVAARPGLARLPRPAAAVRGADAPAADPLPTAGPAGRPDSDTPASSGRHRAHPDDPTGAVMRAAAALRPHLDVAATAEDPALAADLDLATRVAGVVLCYPWLADLCRAAEALHPGAAPPRARRLALATLAGGWLPDSSPAGGTLVDPALLDDPLVLLLAGADADATPGTALAPLDGTPLAPAADAVLARFAGLLRGFERSSPAFVRSSWLLRAGLLDLEREPARLLAQTLPLDIVLGQLPYPVTLLRLPWSVPLTVRFVP